MHAVLDLAHIHRAAITCVDNDVGIGAQRLGKLSAIKVYDFGGWGIGHANTSTQKYINAGANSGQYCAH